MASGFGGPVSATQVGSYFVGQYYQILRKQPELAHQFYTDSSTMIRVDGDMTDMANDLLKIHTLVRSLNFTGIEVKTINSLESWNGGVLVVVSGCIRAANFGGKRNYVETFLLAPQDKGFFVLNDVFHFIDEEVIQQHAAPLFLDNRIDTQLPASTPHHQEIQGYPTNHYDLEAEASEYVDSVHIDGNDQVDDYYAEQLQHQPQVQETYTVLEDIPVEEPSHFHENFVEPVPEPLHSVEEPVGERPKLSYASILRAPKVQSAPSVISRPSYTKSTTPPSEWQQPNSLPQQPIVTEQASLEVTDENPSTEEEVELLKSVYVRNLPCTVTAAEIEQEFKNFGKILPDGIFIKSKKDIGVCFAFVEFDDLQSVHNAIKASPIQMAGRLVHVEERHANSSGARGGRTGRGRGRGSYQPDSYRGQFAGRSSGRGGYQDGGDYNRYRGNGVRG